MGARFGKKDAVIAILLAAVIGLIVWAAVRPEGSSDRAENDIAADPATEVSAEPVVSLASQKPFANANAETSSKSSSPELTKSGEEAAMDKLVEAINNSDATALPV